MDCESTNKATQQTTMEHEFNNTSSKKQFLNKNVSEKSSIAAVPLTSSSTAGKSIKNSTPDNTSDKRLNDSSTNAINRPERTKSECNEKANKTHGQTLAQQENTDVIGTGQRYAGGGIKNSFHGVSYQLKLPMHYIVRGLAQNENFQVATEVEEADKFDDLIFLYEDEIALFQAKHKLDSNFKITEHQLLSTEGDFSVPKYFKSYEQILKNEKLQELLRDKDVTLVLNTNIGWNILQVDENFELITASSILSRKKILALGTEKEKSQYYIIKKKSHLYSALYRLLSKAELEEPSSRVAQHLAAIVLNYENKISKFTQLFEEHREWLLHNVFEVAKEDNKTLNTVDITFKENFSTDSDLKFRKAFTKTYFSNKKTRNDDTASLQKHLSGMKFQIPAHCTLTSKIESAETRQDKVRKFLDILVFAVNQPNETDLGNMIEKEIGDYMGHIDRQSIACKFQLYIQDWAKQKEGYFLKNEDIERQFAVWGQENLSQIRMNDVKKYQCTFEESNDVIKNLSNFLKAENDANVFCLYNRETLLTTIKACQVLEFFASEKIDQKFIFCDIEDLIELESTKKCPVKAFSSQICNTLFVSLQRCKLSYAEVKILHRLLEVINKSNLNGELHSNKRRKRLIMSIPEGQKIELSQEICFDNYGIKSQYLNDFSNCFNELDQKSRRLLMRKGSIIFNSMNVISLLCENDLSHIRDEELLKFIKGKLEINDTSLVTNQYNKEDIKQYYVNRSLVPVIVHRDIIKDTRFHIVLQNTPHTDITNQEVLIVSENDKLFEHYCKTNVNVHWLKQINNKYYWVTSQGTVATLRKYVSAQYLDYNCEPEHCISITNHNELKNDVVLISARPGMGKSVLLSHIAEQSKKEDTSFFVSKINLSDYCEELDRLTGRNVTLQEAIHFVFITIQIESPRIIQGESAFNLLKLKEDGSIAFSPNADFGPLEHLRAMIFCKLYNQEKIVLLLDGFDEIAPDYCESTLNLLQMLKRSKVHKMWITTRPYGIAKDLEHDLGTFTYTLRPLSKDDQLTFFEKFWANKSKSLPTEILTSVKDFLNSVNISTLSSTDWTERNQNPYNRSPNFLSVPLHSHMLAKVLTEDFIKFCSQNNDDASVFTSLTIFDLYSKFFDIKFGEILYKMDILAPQNKPFREIKKTAESTHGKLALLEIFDEKLLTELVTDKDKTQLLNSVQSGNEKTGIVTEVVNNKPRFVHRTFAEYFAALYLAEILLSPEHENREAAKSLLYNSVTGNLEYYYVLFTFFNYKVVSRNKNKDIFEAAIAGNIKKVLESKNVNETFDHFNRTPMHLVANNLFDVLMNFDDAFQAANLTTATTTYNNCRFFFECLCQSMTKRFSDTLFMWTPTHYFAVCPFKFVSQKFTILLQYFNDDTQDIIGRTPLMLLILNKSFSARWIKYSLPFNLTCVNAQDHFQKTALYYAVSNFQKFLIYHIENGLAMSTFLNDLEIICFLLRQGARLDIPDDEGIMPVDIINSLATSKYEVAFDMFLDHEISSLQFKNNLVNIATTFALYITEHVEELGYNAFSFVVHEEVDTSNHPHDAFCNQNLQRLVTRRKCHINKKIEIIFIIILLKQLLDEYDQPILPVLDSEIFSLLFIIKLSPKVAKHIIETTNLHALFRNNDSYKNIFIFMLSETQTIAQILLSEFPHLVDAVDKRGRTALHYAVTNRNEHCVTSLIKSNARLEILDNKGEIPAHINKSEILNPNDDLRYFGVSHQVQILHFINSLPREIANPLVLTMNLYPIVTQIDADFLVYILRNHETIAQVLLSHYPNAVNIKDSKGKTALHYAVIEQNESAIHFLIDNNAQADVADNDGKYPAHLEKNNQDNQESQNTCDDHNRNMLSFIDTLPYYVAKPLVLTMALVPPLTPYDRMIFNHVLDELPTIAFILWTEYSDLVGTTTLMENCSYFDCTKVSDDVVCTLLELYCVEDFSNNALKSNGILKLAAELLISVKNNDLSQMLRVLRSVEYSVIKPNLANVDIVTDEVDIAFCVVNAKSKDGGKTALHYASELGNLEMAELLLSHCAMYNVPDFHGSTPTDIAKTNASTGVLQLLELVEGLFDSLNNEAYDMARGILMNKNINGNLFHCTCFETETSLVSLAIEKKEPRILQLFIEYYHFKADLLDYIALNYADGEPIYSVIDEMNLNETELSDANLNKILEIVKSVTEL